MTLRYIWVKHKRYYLFDTYDSWNEARKVAKQKRNKNKSRYFILPYEAKGFLDIVAKKKYALYLDKVMRLW